jgi:hypothetical protein
MNAVEEALKRIAGHDDVLLVSFRQFVDWLDAQDPVVLAKLRTLAAGEAPMDGWGRFLAAEQQRKRSSYEDGKARDARSARQGRGGGSR